MAESIKASETVHTWTNFAKYKNIGANEVTCIAYNDPQDRLAIASVDHRIRVYEHQGSDWNQLEKWRGHDAEIFDVQWMQCNLGTFLASIGGDNKFKLWAENPRRSNTPGRRFKCLYSQSPSDHVAFDAFGFIVKANDPYLALLSHTGLLTMMEPVELKTLSAWREIDSFYPFAQQSRSSEYTQSLSFKQLPKASPETAFDSLEYQDIVFLAVSMASSFKIFRARKTEINNFQMQEVFEMTTDGTSINAIAWKPDCSQFKDIIALAYDDGWGRLVEVRPYLPPVEYVSTSHPKAQLSKKQESMQTKNSYSTQELAILHHDDDGPLCKVKWIMDGKSSLLDAAYNLPKQGNTLLTSGKNLTTRMWRESINGKWLEFAEMGP